MAENRSRLTPTDPLRVLLLVTRLNIGGPAVHVLHLASDLSAHRVRATLAAGRVGAGEGDMGYLGRSLGVRPIDIPDLVREVSPGRDIKALWTLVRLLTALRPDILHTHTAKAGTLGRAAAVMVNAAGLAGKRVRIVHTFHGHTFHSYFGRWKTLCFLAIERLLGRFTDRIVAIGPLQKADICRRYRIAPETRVAVIPLGFDLDRFDRQGTDRDRTRAMWLQGASEQTFVVGLVGRLTAVKNPWMLLSVAQRVRESGRSGAFRFLVVGDGDLRADLERAVAATGLAHLFAFTGWQEDMVRVYAAVDAVVLTSLNEGTPVSVMEAMAARRTVVATDVGGVKDLMGAERERCAGGFRIMDNGILVASRDAAAMAGALAAVRETPGRFQGLADRASRDIRRRYAPERAVADIAALYRAFFSV